MTEPTPEQQAELARDVEVLARVLAGIDGFNPDTWSDSETSFTADTSNKPWLQYRSKARHLLAAGYRAPSEGREAVLEEAAMVIEQNIVTTTNRPEHPAGWYLVPRKHGNQDGIGYATAIRALKRAGA